MSDHHTFILCEICFENRKSCFSFALLLALASAASALSPPFFSSRLSPTPTVRIRVRIRVSVSVRISVRATVRVRVRIRVRVKVSARFKLVTYSKSFQVTPVELSWIF